MKKLCLESNENGSSLIITGDVDSIFSNRRAARYLKDTVKFAKTDDSIVVEADDDINKSIDRIKKLCEYIGADLVFSGRVSEAVTNYALEEEKFGEFAEKARLIRDNKCDIVSYESNETEHYDRFIEVKCYMGSPHFFWSENESDVARIKADKYILCLVDYLRMGEPGYQPEFIRNPYETIFDSDEWLVNASSYRIQKI